MDTKTVLTIGAATLLVYLVYFVVMILALFTRNIDLALPLLGGHFLFSLFTGLVKKYA